MVESELTQVKPPVAREERALQKPSAENRFVVWIAWLLLALSFVIFLVALIMILYVPGIRRGTYDYRYDYLTGFILLTYSALGALIVSRHPRNPIGWIFITMGVGSELHVLAIGFLTYVNFHAPGSLPVALLVFSLLVNPFILQRALGPLGLLLFPDGKFLSRRWRIIAWIPVGLGVLWYLFSTPGPIIGLQSYLFKPIVQYIIPTINTGVYANIDNIARTLIELFFVAATIGIVLRLRQAKGDQRLQLKWFVYATIVTALITFGLTILDALPINHDFYTVAPNSGLRLPALLSYLAYVLIPVSAFIAIYKYHLYDIDLIINRTLVYVPLTAILAGMYAASVTLFQRLFIASTGQKSDAAVVMSTLFLAATFTPIKNGLQDVVDRRFKEPKDPLKELKEFGKQVEAVAMVINTKHTTQKLLEISIAAFHASSGAIYLNRGGELVLEHASNGWKEGAGSVNLPLSQNGVQLGLLVLGERSDHKEYSLTERTILQQEVNRVAEMVWLTQNSG